MKSIIKKIYEKKGRIYKNQRIGSGRIVFALGKGLDGKIGADLTLYRGKEMYTLIIPEIRNSYSCTMR